VFSFEVGVGGFFWCDWLVDRGREALYACILFCVGGVKVVGGVVVAWSLLRRESMMGEY
jgi:hypothetical protein